MIRRLKEIMFSTEFTIQERFIQLTGIVGSTAAFCVLIINAFTGQSPPILIGIGVAFVIFVLVTYIMIRYHKYRVISNVAVLLSVCIVLPFGYLTGGGAFSGSPIWLLIYFIMVFMMFKGKMLAFYLGLAVISAGITTYVGAVHPEIVIPLNGEYAIFWDTYLSVIVVGLIIGGLIQLQTHLFERENRIAREQKEEIEALNDTQSRFFSSMSHEIRTPINTIIGLNELTLREEGLSDEVVENCTQIQEASKMLLSLINDILDLSKIESARMEVVQDTYETTRLLSEIVNLLWNRAREKGLRFDINVGEAIPSMLYGDSMRLKQIIVNLLTNAIKYTNEGGVTLNVEGEKQGANDFLLRIDVIDTGIGIRKESLPYLFDSFRRVDDNVNSSVEGTGLGLSIARQLTELMGGKISVDSIYTKGSTFHVEIPQHIVNESPINFRAIAEVTRESQGTSYHQAFEAPEARVLIVDDNDMNRVVATKLLRGTQVKVDQAASGRECLDKTVETHYDAIFMDHVMPDMDGVETLRKLRSQTNGLNRETPVIALTANAGADMGAFYADNGFQAYLAKPIHSSLLEATLMQILPTELIEKQIVTHEEETVTVGTARRRRSVIITADVVCDIPQAMVQEYGIRLMPFYCVTDSGRFRDLFEIDADNLLRYMSSGRGKVHTEPSPVSEYEAFFGSALSEAEQVIHITMSSAIDGNGHREATQAAASFANVHVYDGRGISSGIGMVALHAAKLARAGKTVPEILSALDSYVPRVRSAFLVPHPEALDHIDFSTAPLYIASRVFNLEPVLRTHKGKIVLSSFSAGYVNDPVEVFVRRTLANVRDADKAQIFINYCGCTLQEREDVRAYVRKYSQFNEIVEQKVSATLSCNCGMHSIGLTYVKKGK